MVLLNFYSPQKHVLAGTFEELLDVTNKAVAQGANVGLIGLETVEQKLKKLQKLIFDLEFENTLTQKSPGNTNIHFYVIMEIYLYL